MPIVVVENPTIQVRGKNLLNNKYPAYRAGYNSGVAFIKRYEFSHPSAELPHTTTNCSTDGFGFLEKLQAGKTYTLKVFNRPKDKAIVCVAGYSSKDAIVDASNKVWYLPERSVNNPVQFTVEEGGEYVVFTFAAEWGDGTNKITYPENFKAQLEVSDSVTDCTPYVSAELTIALPAEHPYLAKLPDGKADEIVVDGDGNVELVARVGIDKDVRKVGVFKRGEYYSLETHLSSFSSPDEDYAGTMLCSALLSKAATPTNEGIYRTWTGVYVRDSSGRTKEEIQAEVDKNAPLTVVGAIPITRYPLGKIDMPKAQDSIVNVWTDAEVTPKTGIEYTRDVNIVVANLESAIASIS